MRKFAFEINVNGKHYSNKLRQAVVNYIEDELNKTNKSLHQICANLPQTVGVSRRSGYRWYNALGNAAKAKKVTLAYTNVKPILDSEEGCSKYSEEFRKKVMKFAMRFGVLSASRKYKVSPHSVYDWIKAYGYSTAYFNR